MTANSIPGGCCCPDPGMRRAWERSSSRAGSGLFLSEANGKGLPTNMSYLDVETTSTRIAAQFKRNQKLRSVPLITKIRCIHKRKTRIKSNSLDPVLHPPRTSPIHPLPSAVRIQPSRELLPQRLALRTPDRVREGGSYETVNCSQPSRDLFESCTGQ